MCIQESQCLVSSEVHGTGKATTVPSPEAKSSPISDGPRLASSPLSTTGLHEPLTLAGFSYSLVSVLQCYSIHSLKSKKQCTYFTYMRREIVLGVSFIYFAFSSLTEFMSKYLIAHSSKQRINWMAVNLLDMSLISMGKGLNMKWWKSAEHPLPKDIYLLFLCRIHLTFRWLMGNFTISR